MSSPDWDDGTPYAGPPQYGPVQYGPTQYGPAQYGPSQYGPSQYGPQPAWGPPPGYPPPGWGWGAQSPPPRPQRPGSVIAAAVFAFVSALLVLMGTLYAAAFSALLSLARGPGTGIGPWFALLQLAVAALLVIGGVRVLGRNRRWLLAAAAAQLALCGYWFAALADLAPAMLTGTALVLPVPYVVLAALAAGLSSLPDARAWTAAATAATTATTTTLGPATPPGAGG